MVHSFAAKLAVFVLNAIPEDKEIQFSQTSGFSSKLPEVAGILPLLHMNVSKQQFASIMKSSEKSIEKIIKKKCFSSKTEDKLDTSINFKCAKQSVFAANTLVDRFIETIESGYSSRRRGRKLMKEIAKYMKWQASVGKIPISSTIWFTEIRGIETL